MKIKSFLVIALIATTTMFVACSPVQVANTITEVLRELGIGKKSDNEIQELTESLSKQTKKTAKKIVEWKVAEMAAMSVGEQLDYMTTCTGVTFDGRDVTITCEVDEDYCPLASIYQLDWEEVKKVLKQIWKTDKNRQELANQVKLLGGTVNYVYVGSITGETVSYSLW